jgi:hypothetical protein
VRRATSVRGGGGFGDAGAADGDGDGAARLTGAISSTATGGIGAIGAGFGPAAMIASKIATWVARLAPTAAATRVLRRRGGSVRAGTRLGATPSAVSCRITIPS